MVIRPFPRARVLTTLPFASAAFAGTATALAEQAPPLPEAVSGQREVLDTPTAGRVSLYYSIPDDPVRAARRPLLLIHSVNAAGSVYEVKPLFEHYRRERPVYAPDLPGFGFSERSDRAYTPRLMTDAIHAVVETLQARHPQAELDALALSLASEFLARAAVERPEPFRSVALISPTGFNRSRPSTGAPGSHKGMAWLRRMVSFPLWGESFFDLLTSRKSIRFFLKKTFGTETIDEGMLEYDYQTIKQPGARYAPYYFISGYLFSDDITEVYEQLEQPVWMAHGVRGDFVDFRYKPHFEDRSNWDFHVFETGALPHFEQLETFVSAYDAFLAGIDDSSTPSDDVERTSVPGRSVETAR